MCFSTEQHKWILFACLNWRSMVTLWRTMEAQKINEFIHFLRSRLNQHFFSLPHNMNIFKCLISVHITFYCLLLGQYISGQQWGLSPQAGLWTLSSTPHYFSGSIKELQLQSFQWPWHSEVKINRCPPFFPTYAGHSWSKPSSKSLFYKGLLSFIFSLTKIHARKSWTDLFNLLLDNLIHTSTLLGPSALCNTDILTNKRVLSPAH